MHQYQRGPTQIVLNLTNQCNLKCKHCFNESKVRKCKNELSDHEFISLVEEIFHIKPFNVCFSGGEPLLRKNLLIESTKILVKGGIRVVLVTNGTMLDRDTINLLWEAGISEIDVSIDGSNPESHERLRGLKGSFLKTINAFKALKEIGIQNYAASMTLTPFNYTEIEEVVNLLEEYGCSILSVRPMLPVGMGDKYKKELCLSSLEYRFARYTVKKIQNQKRKIKIIFKDPLSHILVYYKENFFYGMEISAEGGLFLSPYIKLELGNIRRHNITEYWEAGWPYIYNHPLIKEKVRRISCSDDLIEINKEVQRLRGFDLIDNNNDSGEIYNVG